MDVFKTERFNKNFQKLNKTQQTQVLVGARSIQLEDATKNIKQLKGMQPNEIYERKYTFKGGLRLYFCKIDDDSLLYLDIGTKGTQKQDIKRLNKILEDWTNEHRP